MEELSWSNSFTGIVNSLKILVCLFSFSLYLLVLTGISTLAMITPIGGLLLIISWLGVAFRARRFSS